MSESSKAISLRDEGEREPTPLRTRAVWAGAGSQGMSPEIVRALALIGERLGLEPALGEVMLLGNRVYVTLLGYIALAQRDARFEGIQIDPMTEAERKAAKVGDDEHAWKASIYRKGWRVPAIGYGIASERNIQAAPIKQFARELAEARAVRRALRLAFGFRGPEVDEAVDLATGEVIGNVPLIGMDAAEPKVTEIAPDWARFWAHIRGLGVEHEEAHKVLGVGSLHDWPGSLDEAVAQIERYVLTRDRTPAQPTTAPAAGPAKASRPSTREDMLRRYRMLCEKADGLGLRWPMLDPQWSDDELRANGKALAASVSAAEAQLFAGETATTASK